MEDDESGQKWLLSFGENVVEQDDGSARKNSVVGPIAYERADVELVVHRLNVQECDNLIDDYDQRRVLVEANMDNWDWYRGELLRQTGAIEALLCCLVEVKPHMGHRCNMLRISKMKLAIACWRAIRELACGNLDIRTSVRLFNENGVDGLELLVLQLAEYNDVAWIEMDDLDLQLVTAVIGALRNVSHKTPENCEPLHVYGVSPLLAWRLLHNFDSNEDSELPDQAQPWREACFRAAGTLINIAEEYTPCLDFCSTNARLISVLLQSWGENNRLSSFFGRLLRTAKRVLPDSSYKVEWEKYLREV